MQPGCDKLDPVAVRMRRIVQRPSDAHCGNYRNFAPTTVIAPPISRPVQANRGHQHLRRRLQAKAMVPTCSWRNAADDL